MPLPRDARRYGAELDSSTGDLELAAYFARIGYGGVQDPTLDTLVALHRAHVLAIPFENLSVALGQEIPLDLGSLQAKLVRGARGGYCYEHALLFFAVLHELGFAVTRLSARTMAGDRSRARTHALLLVDVEGHRYIADVGYGNGGFLEPVPLRQGEWQQGGWRFRLERASGGVWLMEGHAEGRWSGLYRFTTEPHRIEDYSIYNYYCSTHPKSPFVRRPIVQAVADDGRQSLVGRKLVTLTGDGRRTEREVHPHELGAVLADTFGLAVGEDLLEAVRRRWLETDGAVPRAGQRVPVVGRGPGADAAAHVVVVSTSGGIVFSAIEDSFAALNARLSGYLAEAAEVKLWPEAAAKVLALLEEGDLKEAASVYFSEVGDRWDREYLHRETLELTSRA